eukprot:gnl/MRDRNA2_/MRDRNA2_109136_c0_seq1.p1 gnl/MRDRNA2_/MRDRNA2_109136_c0~~gnl/MRDRNA2_/MRDRNA2_109136_c0_seq1.p1  ORF type:complete len:222 (-),score=13.22 gnl/MRDRNA2_/MRDRNA2_109136_c0_seq1:12-677(-)
MPFLEHEGYSLRQAPLIFCCIKLETAVLIRACIEFFLCLMTLYFVVFFGKGLGSLLGLKAMRITHIVEVILCIAGLLFSALGVHAITHYRDERSRLGEYGSARSSAASRLFRFLLFYATRIVFTVPILGIGVVAANVCGTYVHGTAVITGAFTTGGLHCSEYDVMLLFLVLACLALDLYLLWGTLSLWQLYQYGGIPSTLKTMKYSGPILVDRADYGTTVY